MALYTPFLNAVLRKPAGKYYIWYRGEKVATFDFNFHLADSLSTWVYTMGTERIYGRPVETITLPELVRDARPEPTDFAIGAEGDARLLDFHFDFSPEHTADAYRIFREVFGGQWATLGKWAYSLKLPKTLRSTPQGNRWWWSNSKTLQMSYTVPTQTEVDSQTGSEYEVEVDNAPDFEHAKFVFLADGKLLQLPNQYKPAHEVPADLKLEDVKMAGLPLIWWLLMFRPTEFVDVATVCMRFKKMLHDQCEVRFPRYYHHQFWLMNGDEMVKVHATQTKVIVDGKTLSIPEIEALHDRKNDFWMGCTDLGSTTLRKLYTEESHTRSSSLHDISA